MKYRGYGYKENNDVIEWSIDKDYFNDTKTAKAFCLFGVEIEEKFALLLDNYTEFEMELLRLAQISLIWAPHNREHTEAMKERLTLDRRLVNFLTACRLYLDQSLHGISRQFGHGSQQLKDLKQRMSNLHNNYSGYRIMNAMRNHVQHSSLPVRIIYYEYSFHKGKKNDYTEFRVVPKAQISDVKEDQHFDKSVLKEIEDLGETPDLRNAIREYMDCLVSLHGFLRELIVDRFGIARTTYESVYAEATSLNGEKVRFPRLVELDDNGFQFEEIALFLDFLSYYDNLRRLNVVNKKLVDSFASNSIAD